MRKTSLFLLGLLLTVSISQSAFAQFYDLGKSKNVEAINWLQENKVVKGFSGNLFKPENDITRAEFLKIILESTGMDKEAKPGIEFSELTFSDIYPDEWYYDYVAYARTRGIIKGYEDGTFKPNNPILFPEALKIVNETVFSSDEIEDSCNESADDGNYERSDCNDPWYWKYAIFSWKLKIFPEYHEDLNEAMTWKLRRGDMAEITYRSLAIRDNTSEGAVRSQYQKGMLPNDLPIEEEETDDTEETEE
jgi:hypothetical protein